MHVVGVKSWPSCIENDPKTAFPPQNRAKNYMLKSCPSCPHNFEQKTATISTYTVAKILTWTFSVRISWQMRSPKNLETPILQCFWRNRGLHSQEVLLPKQNRTPKTSRIASILRHPGFSTKSFFCLRTQTPQNSKKNTVSSKSLFCSFFQALFSDVFFAFLTKCPPMILTSTFSCPLFLTSPPPRKHRNTYYIVFFF